MCKIKDAIINGEFQKEMISEEIIEIAKDLKVLLQELDNK